MLNSWGNHHIVNLDMVQAQEKSTINEAAKAVTSIIEGLEL